MALTLNPKKKYREGIVRCLTSREGEVHVAGYIDRSVLYKVAGQSLEQFELTDPLTMKRSLQIINELSKEKADYLGLEDPDIWLDENTDLIHVYFTIPFISKDSFCIHLGHAVGRDLDSLEMTFPVLRADKKSFEKSVAKEVAIAPINSKGIRYNLFEGVTRSILHSYECSAIRIAPAEDLGGTWYFGEVVFHPEKEGIPWIEGHASPGPLFPRAFLDIGKYRVVGLINGREKNKIVNNQIYYGVFSIGLCVYDYEHGRIEWVSPEPFIRDSQATTITFASQFVQTDTLSGMLYAHVDDSFIRAYVLNATAMRDLIPRVYTRP